MSGSTSRMLALLSLLQARRDWPGAVLADRLGVSPRTVRRDIDRLRELGYRIGAAKGPDGGYRLAAGEQLPPLLFDDEQAVAIAIALRTVAASGVDVAEAAERALATVGQVLPSRLRHRVDRIRFSAETPAVVVDPAVLDAVSTAVRDRTTLRFGYRDEDAPARRTHPHAVVARAGRWYLIAWDLDRDDWRVFRLDRMRPRTPAGARFAPRPLPARDARELLEARLKGSRGEDRWPCVGEVVVDLPAHELAPWIGDGDLEPRPDGSCLLRVGSWSWAGVLARVAHFDAPMQIIGPSELHDAAAVLAARLAPPA